MIENHMAKEMTIIDQPACFFSTPEYVKTFWGGYKLSYCLGSAQLTNNRIIYRSKEVNFELPLNYITDMSIGTFERTKDSFHLNYLALTYKTQTGVGTILLMPAKSRFSQTWTINRHCKDWFESICKLTGQSYEMFRPYPQTHNRPGETNVQSSEAKKDLVDEIIQSKLSVIPKPMLIIISIIFIMIMMSFTVTWGVVGFFLGLLTCAFFIIPTYIVFWVQSTVLGHIRENKNDNILFKMWSDMEEGEFMGPFKGKK